MPYVNQIGDAQFPPPYTFPDVEILSFRLPASLDALTKLCNDLLNIGDLDDRGFTFRPMFPFVDLEVLHYPKMEYAVFPQFGTISQHECYIRVFVMKYLSIGGWLVPDGEVAMYCPFLSGGPSLVGVLGPRRAGFSKAHRQLQRLLAGPSLCDRFDHDLSAPARSRRACSRSSKSRRRRRARRRRRCSNGRGEILATISLARGDAFLAHRSTSILSFSPQCR